MDFLANIFICRPYRAQFFAYYTQGLRPGLVYAAPTGLK